MWKYSKGSVCDECLFLWPTSPLWAAYWIAVWVCEWGHLAVGCKIIPTELWSYTDSKNWDETVRSIPETTHSSLLNTHTHTHTHKTPPALCNKTGDKPCKALGAYVWHMSRPVSLTANHLPCNSRARANHGDILDELKRRLCCETLQHVYKSTTFVFF